MARFARVDNGEVVEIINLPEGIALEDAFTSDLVAAMHPAENLDIVPGWTRAGGAFSPPAGPSLEALKSVARAAVNAKRDAIIAAGYQHNFGATAGIRTLDQRGPEDAINWLGLKGIADSAIAGGQGAALIAIRDAGDETFEASANVVSSAMVAMGQWRGAIMGHAWALKDAIAAAADEAALAAIDIDAGWPA